MTAQPPPVAVVGWRGRGPAGRGPHVVTSDQYGQLQFTPEGIYAKTGDIAAGGAGTGGLTLPIPDGDVLGNISGGSAQPAAVGASALLDHVFGSAQGDILYRDSSAWKVLAPGTSGFFLKTQGSAANPIWAAGNAGTVTSVGLALDSGLYTVSGSPVNSSGTLTGTLNTQSANTVFAGPTTGAAAKPAFRAIVAADLPTTYFFPPITAPAAPATGFLIYCDTADGKLKAIASTSTITILALP